MNSAVRRYFKLDRKGFHDAIFKMALRTKCWARAKRCLIAFSQIAMLGFLPGKCHGEDDPKALSGRVFLGAAKLVFQQMEHDLSGMRADMALELGDVDGNGEADLFGVLPTGDELWVSFSSHGIFQTPVVLTGLSAECLWKGERQNPAYRTAPRFDRKGAIQLFAFEEGRKQICLARYEAGSFVVSKFAIANGSFGRNEPLLGKYFDHTGSLHLFFGSASKVLEWRLSTNPPEVHFLRELPLPGPFFPSAVDDIDGLQQPELVAVGVGHGFQLTRCKLGELPLHCGPWLEFIHPPNQSWSSTPPAFLPGDFNGDGRLDALRFNSGIGGTWLGVSGKGVTLEQEIPALGVAPTDSLLVGDTDGDGIDEVVRADPARAKVTRWRLQRGKAVGGVQLFLDEIGPSVSSDDGSYLFKTVTGGRKTLRAQFPSGLTVELPVMISNSPRSIANVVVSSLQTGHSRRGEALTLDGIVIGPSVCIGYRSEAELHSSKWGTVMSGDCPEGYALFASSLYNDTSPTISFLAGEERKAVKIAGSCCKLPAFDILTKEHRMSPDDCPEGFVATGVHFEEAHASCEECGYVFRCTAINRARYRLADSMPGLYWGTGVDMLMQKQRIARWEIPAVIRYGVGRLGFRNWESHGCIGRPWGSILVSKGVNFCSAFKFRQLQYQGITGDPAAGTPVQIFPDCERVENIFDPLTGCG